MKDKTVSGSMNLTAFLPGGPCGGRLKLIFCGSARFYPMGVFFLQHKPLCCGKKATELASGFIPGKGGDGFESHGAGGLVARTGEPGQWEGREMIIKNNGL